MHNICRECGMAANVATCLARHGKMPNKIAFDVSTMSKGKCEYCGRETWITEERDFFYPNTKIINWEEFRKEMNGKR